MKAISLTQPMAWACFNGKDIDNRSWSTRYRGVLLIHASNDFNQEHYDWISQNENRLGLVLPQPEEFVHGALIGKVDLTVIVKNKGGAFQPGLFKDYQDRAFRVVGSRWFWGPYGWVFENAVEFQRPIPVPGELRIFDIPDEELLGTEAEK